MASHSGRSMVRPLVVDTFMALEWLLWTGTDGPTPGPPVAAVPSPDRPHSVTRTEVGARKTQIKRLS